MVTMKDEEIVAELRQDYWLNKSSSLIATGLGVSAQKIRHLRQVHGLTPTEVECKNGVIAKKGLRGRKMGRALTEQERELVAKAMPLARKHAGYKSNEILDYHTLLSLVHITLVQAVKKWRPSKQKGIERKPGSKWLGFALSCVKLAVSREFYHAKEKLKKTALTGNHPYQKWFVRGRLIEAGRGNGEGTFEKLSGRVVRTGHGKEVEAEDSAPESTLSSRLDELEGQDRIIIEGIAGLDGRTPWDQADVAEFFMVSYPEAKRMIEAAKQALVE